MIPRRTILATGAASFLAAANSVPGLRLGVLPFGSVHWVADVLLRHGLDRKHGFILQTSLLANTDASRVALLGDSVDVAVLDWTFVAAQRAKGGDLCFSPFSSANGGVMVPAGSPVKTLGGLKGLRLGVAGGPADKSWLIVQAAGRAQGIDLAHAAVLSYGAPPLLGGLLQKQALDAVLTFWPYAARLEAAGMREALSVGDCAAALGLPSALDLVGFVFNGGWAKAHRALIDGFIAAAAEACDLLGRDQQEWVAVRRLMDAPEEALFQALRRRFVAGVHRPDAPAEKIEAGKVLRVLAGGGQAPASLPPGVFWGDDAA